MTRARTAAILALVLLAAGALGAVYDFIDDFPVAVILLVAFGLALWAGWAGLFRTGAAGAGLGCGRCPDAVVVVTIATEGVMLGDVLVLGCLAAAVAAARVAFIVHIPLARVRRPTPDPVRQPLVRRGQGRALPRRRRGPRARIRAVELHPGDDLRDLVAAAIERGADGLAMALGDGSPAIVAAAAAERGCRTPAFPPGPGTTSPWTSASIATTWSAPWTRSSTGASTSSTWREVNGRVFVNNVSLGVYAAAVQREGYRDAKLRTLLATIPETLGAEGESLDLRWQGPGGHEHAGGAAVLVSNNRYRLGRALANATRPRIDDGLLGVTVLGAPRGRGESSRSLQRPWREWSAPTFDVESSAPRADRHRRRGRRAHPAAPLSDSPRRTARADRRRASRCLTVRAHPRRRRGNAARARHDRRGATQTNN